MCLTEGVIKMDLKSNLKTEATSRQLHDAIKTIHTMSMTTIAEVFCVTYKFYDKDNLIYHVLQKFTAEEIVSVVGEWKAQRTFNKNDIVINFASRECYVVTYTDKNNIHLIGADGKTYKHNASGFEKWFGKTENTVDFEHFLLNALTGSKG